MRVGWPTLTEYKFSEARLEALALELTREGRAPLVGVPSSAGFDHSPVSVYLYVPAFLFTTDPIPATIYGGLVNVAAVALCWGLARRWPGGGRWPALVSALLFAVSPWAVLFSRKIWQVAFVPLLALACVGWIVSALARGRAWSLCWAMLAYALLVQVHPSAISLAPALVLWLVIFRRQVRLRPLATGTGLGILTAMPFLVHQVQSGWPALSAVGALGGAAWDMEALRQAWDAVTGRGIETLAGAAHPLLTQVPELAWTYNLVGWLVLAAGGLLTFRMAKSWRSQNAFQSQAARIDLILLTWLIVPVAFNLRHGLSLYLHFFALVLPAAYLVVGRAVEAAYHLAYKAGAGQTVLRTLSRVAAGGLLMLAAGQVAGLTLMGHFVSTNNTAGGFGTSLGQSLSIARSAVARAQEIGAEVVVVGQGDSPVVDATPAIFDVLLRDEASYRFVDARSAALFPAHSSVILQAPDAGQAAQWYEPWPAVPLGGGFLLRVLDGAWPKESFNTVASPRLFQDGVEIQGYAWDPREGQGGAQISLLWQVLWRNPTDTHFSMRLVDKAGILQGQQDAAGYPAETRRKGDRVVSRFDITLADTTSDSLWARVGMYSYPQVVYVPVLDTAGNPTSDAVQFGPLTDKP